jgi:hypothetical protein
MQLRHRPAVPLAPMHEAFLHWLMTPDAEDLLALEDFLGRPAWHTEAFVGAGAVRQGPEDRLRAPAGGPQGLPGTPGVSRGGAG